MTNGSADGGSADGGRTGDANADGGAAEANRRAWAVAIFLAMALSGTVIMVRGPVVEGVGETFSAPLWQLGLISTAGSAGYLLSIVPTGFGMGYVDARRVIVVGIAGSGVAMLAMGVAPLFGVFLAGILVRGVANGLARGVDRPLLSHLYPERRGRLYSYYDLTWAVGATAGPLLVVAVFLVADWRAVYSVLGVASLVVAAFVWRLDAPEVQTNEAAFDLGDVRTLTGRPEVVVMVLALACTSGVESGLYLWLPLYASGELPGWIAALSLSLLIVGFVPGRYAFGRLTDRYDYLPLLVGATVLLVPTFAATFLFASGYWVLPGILAVGVLVSGYYPLLTAYATDAAPEHAGPIAAIAAVGSNVGFAAAPAAMGWLMGGGDATLGMVLLLALLVVTLVVLVVGRARAPTPTVPASATGD